jgi:hypothetical protein
VAELKGSASSDDLTRWLQQYQQEETRKLKQKKQDDGVQQFLQGYQI